MQWQVMGRVFLDDGFAQVEGNKVGAQFWSADNFEVMSRPEAMRYWTRPAHDDIGETLDFLKSMAASGPAERRVISREAKALISEVEPWAVCGVPT